MFHIKFYSFKFLYFFDLAVYQFIQLLFFFAIGIVEKNTNCSLTPPPTHLLLLPRLLLLPSLERRGYLMVETGGMMVWVGFTGGYGRGKPGTCINMRFRGRSISTIWCHFDVIVQISHTQLSRVSIAVSKLLLKKKRF